MEKKLIEDKYKDWNGFHKDFELMIKNCNEFNEPGSQVYIMGQEFHKYYKLLNMQYSQFA